METQKIIAGIVAGGTLVMGGVDASVMNETPIQRVDAVAHERVEAKQIGNVVETTLPWKGENGLKVKYDMGEPTASEKIKDKRGKEVVTDLVDFGDGGFKVDILLNKKPDTNVFCYTIEGAENYDFWYQPALTQQEIDEGSERPDNIIGSYAVYHKTLRNHVVGKTNYETGKVMHIPRPQVWEVNDKENTTIWADLSYNEGQLCVTVDNTYLQKAKYPVRVDPTFGYTSAGASSDNIQSYWKGNKYTVVEDGTITSFSHYTGDTSAGLRKRTVALYQSGSGSKNLLDYSAENTTNSAKQWFTDTAQVGYNIVSGTEYRLTINYGNNTTSVGYDTTGAPQVTFVSSSYTYPPSSPNTFYDSGYGARKFSIYATYTADGGGGGSSTTPNQDIIFFD